MWPYNNQYQNTMSKRNTTWKGSPVKGVYITNGRQWLMCSVWLLPEDCLPQFKMEVAYEPLHDKTNKNDRCAQRRFRSACASLCALWVAKNPVLLHADSEDWSDWADAFVMLKLILYTLSCSFGLPRVPFVNCRLFIYLVISLSVYRAGCGIWLYQFLIIAYLFTLLEHSTFSIHNTYCV